ncbi:hypothetical protein CFRS1_v007902 [Colletotrichum fructicola]|nr:hypothetical protein CFRS1_v007902 [Colletotrichum fructicola]
MLPEPGMANILTMYIKSTGSILELARLGLSHPHTVKTNHQLSFSIPQSSRMHVFPDPEPAMQHWIPTVRSPTATSEKLLEAVLADTRLCPQLSSDNEGCSAW